MSVITTMTELMEEVRTVREQLAETQAHLDAQQQATEQAVAREQTAKKQLVMARREVWERAASRIDYYNDDPGHFDPRLQKIVEWMREQAKAEETR